MAYAKFKDLISPETAQQLLAMTGNRKPAQAEELQQPVVEAPPEADVAVNGIAENPPPVTEEQIRDMASNPLDVRGPDLSQENENKLVSSMLQQREQAKKELMPLIDMSKQSLNEAQGLTDQLVDTPRKVDLSPLAALVDQSTGSNLAKTITKDTETESERRARAVDAANKILDKRNDLIKQAAAALGGSNQMGINRLLGTTNRNEEAQYRSLIDKIDKDPTIKNQFSQLRNLDNAAALVEKSDVVTPQQFHDFQQAVLSNLGIKGQQAVGEREEKYFNDLGLKGDKVVQFLKMTPVSIGKNNPFLVHLKDLARYEVQNSQGQIKQNLDAIGAGYDYLWSRRPDLRRGFESKIDAYAAKTKTKYLETEKSTTTNKPTKINKDTPTPAGMKKQQNSETGEYRFVPIK